MIDINWFVHESPGLKSDGFGEISNSKGNIQTGYYILNAQKPFQKWEEDILADNSLKSAYHFFCGQEPRLAFLAMSFVRIKTTNNCCNTITAESNT